MRSHRETLVRYLAEKASLEDWHGVMDAAADLREIDSELRGMVWKKNPGSFSGAR